MAENKTRPTGASVDAFLDTVEPVRRRADGKELRALMERLSDEPATMWGPSIIGFGSYHYRYASGREGDACRIGFSPRRTKLVLYLSCSLGPFAPLLDQLGPHDRGVGCLYLKTLDEIDRSALETLIAAALASPDYP